MGAVAHPILPRLKGSLLSFIESVPDAMVLSDTEGKIVLVNTATEKLFGYGRREVLGQEVEVLIPARFHDLHRRHRANYYSNPAIKDMGSGRVVLARRKDGGELCVEINLSHIKIGNKLFVWRAIRDVRGRETLSHRIGIALNRQGLYRGLIMICSWCTRACDERGSWQTLEKYIALHSEITFTHGICGDCLQKLERNYRADFQSESLMAELDEARRRFLESSRNLLELTREVPSGTLHPDRGTQLQRLADAQRRAFDEYLKARKKLEDHMDAEDGRIKSKQEEEW